MFRQAEMLQSDRALSSEHAAGEAALMKKFRH